MNGSDDWMDHSQWKKTKVLAGKSPKSGQSRKSSTIAPAYLSQTVEGQSGHVSIYSPIRLVRGAIITLHFAI